MAKQYYVSELVFGNDRGWYPRILDVLGEAQISVVNPPADPVTGAPTGTWCLCVVGGIDHRALRAAAGVTPLPDFPLDGKVNGINAAVKNATKAKLKAHGLPATLVEDWFERGDGYRDAIRGIGRELEPDFSEANFDCQD